MDIKAAIRQDDLNNEKKDNNYFNNAYVDKEPDVIVFSNVRTSTAPGTY